MQQPYSYSGYRKSVRRRSEKIIFGLPLYDIAIGPDPQNNLGMRVGLSPLGMLPRVGWRVGVLREGF